MKLEAESSRHHGSSALLDGIKWLSAKELLTYLETHDWKGDYSWYDNGETKQFVEQATAMMREWVNDKTGPLPPNYEDNDK